MPAELSADGTVVVIVPFSIEEQRSTIQSPMLKTMPKHVVCGVSAPVAGVSHLLSELKRWEWVRNNSQELSFDQFARDYVRDEVERLRASLGRDLEFLTELAVDHNRPVHWFHARDLALIEMQPSLWKQLSPADIEELCQACRIGIETYYARLTP